MDFIIDPSPLQIKDLEPILSGTAKLKLSENCVKVIANCRNYLLEKLADTGKNYYGINTGFGSLCNVRIEKSELQDLQKKLILSHACGTGDLVPVDICRLILFLKIRNLCFGHSGVRVALVEKLIAFYNAEVYPVIYEMGSLGASGDLAPLAHLSLPLIGEGEVHYQGEILPAATVMQKIGIEPLTLESKEGLALLNGTQFSTGYGIWSLLKAQKIMHTANLCAAISIDAFDCNLSPFDARIHLVRPHNGQMEVAAQILEWLKESAIGAGEKVNVQDPYSFRCVPQVHGATKDVMGFVEKTLTVELNAITDNPNLFPDSDGIISGGNFHAQPIAYANDFLAIALAELGSISERRTYLLISGKRGLPPFLSENPGLNSGFMIPQYTAASLASQNKQLCTPASVDSIVSSNGQEDHVSMAANAGTKLIRIVKNVERILGIEWLTACQALDFRLPNKTSPAIESIHQKFRALVPRMKEDRLLAKDMEASINFLKGL